MHAQDKPHFVFFLDRLAAPSTAYLSVPFVEFTPFLLHALEREVQVDAVDAEQTNVHIFIHHLNLI